MKRFLAAALAMAMLFTFLPTFVFAEKVTQGEIIATHYYGDADFDDVLNTRDAAIILKICSGQETLTEKQSELTYEGCPRTDANKDKNINTADATYILRVAADMKTANEYCEYAPDIIEYTVTFKDGLTGNVISTVDVREGENAQMPTPPAHEGYTFNGWDNDGKNITADIIITAQYSLNVYSVTFKDGLTGSVISTQNIEHGKDATLPVPPAHDGYSFTGWDSDGKNITADTTITAQYAINVHTVTFMDGLDGSVISTQNVEHGKDATLPTPPAHEGYTFTKWDSDGKNITADITITALYEKNIYTVTFVDGLTGDVVKTVRLEHGNDVTLPIPPAHEGYTFTGWDHDGKNITSDVTITAQYEKHIYTVTFIDGYTGDVISTQQVEHGKDATLPTPPVHEGQTFNTWSSDGKNITADTTITAIYSTNVFTVTYTDGLTGETISSEMVEYGKDANLPVAPVHEGYTFTGWSSDGKNITANTIITAQYELNVYTVTFIDGCTNTVIDEIRVNHGESVMFPEEPEHTGYTFTGWDKTGENITSDITITALYEINVYTVTFVDSFTGETISTQQVEHGKDAALPTPPVHEGETFSTWSSDGKNITADTTITAFYTVNVYTVTYIDGITGETISSEFVEYGHDANLPGAPEHEGYHFTGWDGDGKNITTDTVITALYMHDDCSVVFKDGLTGETLIRDLIEYGADVTDFPDAPEHEGYHFTGWDHDGKNITSDTIITAQYEINTYTVTFIDGLTNMLIDRITVNHGDDVMFPREPLHDGYTFTGWDHDGMNITADTTITALYSVTTFTVTFIDGVTNEVISEAQVAQGANAVFPAAPEHEGYDFTSWDGDGMNITEDTTITAKYRIQQRIITFIDGLTGEIIMIMSVDYGQDAMFPTAPYHEGYTCTGWDSDGTHITENVTITAHYAVNKFVVSFIDGITHTIIASASVEYGQDVTFPEPPVHDGYRFAGWDHDGKNITSHLSITALYEVDGVQITLNLTDALNGLSIEPATATMTVSSGTTTITDENAVLPDGIGAWGPFSVTVTVTNGVASPAQISVNCGPTTVGDDGNTYFVLKNMTGFYNMETYMFYNYKLTFDIDLASENFKPFGYNLSSPGDSPAAYLEGIFDGEGHTIENLYIWPQDLPGAGSATYYDNVGLFSGNDGVIKNLYVTTGAKTSTDYGVFGDRTVGIIAGRNYGKIENCHVYGNAGAVSYATAASGQNKSMGACGGICGANIDEGVITRCSMHGQIEGYFWLGGIVGKNWGTVSESYFVGGINPWMDDSYLDEFDVQYIGGICGGMTGGSVQDCYVYITDGIIGTLAVGGLVGWISGGVLRNCLVMNVNSSTIYCYLDSADYFAGWVQSNPSVASNLYYSNDSSYSGIPAGFGAEWDTNATEMNTFPDLVNNRRDEYFIW